MLREAIETLVLLLSPFTPHVCEEMWERLGPALQRGATGNWPVATPDVAREDELELAVQVNGKVRARDHRAGGRAAKRRSKASGPGRAARAEHLAGKQIVKVVVVPGRLVSVVVK